VNWILGVGAFLVIAALLYWQLIIAEGAYLGRRVVALLYDWSAHVYDRIKHFDTGYEQYFLARPITNALFSFPSPVVLDVATGTARLARTLFPEVGFRGRIVGLDLSRKMLEQAAQETARWSDRTLLLWDDASQLPFPDDTFEVTACLEATEFMPDPEGVLAEMIRVLRPGGLFLTTNRVGNDARLMPGRTFTSESLTERLQSLSLEMVQVRPWQVEYDLVWGVKPGVCAPLGARRLESLLHCPECQAPVSRQPAALTCANGHAMPIADDGIVDMLHVQRPAY
jgi:ubiquinone/menaquinone biosynthesis C-methylase UbiE